jgi:hypothetical protein
MATNPLRSMLSALVVAVVAVGVPSVSSGAEFALLINGDASSTHTQNVEIASAALVELGYPRANILSAGDRSELRGAMSELERRLGPSDVLLLYTTGHGARRSGESRLYLRSGELGAGELSRLVFGLKFRRLIYIGDQCYSGGFATTFGATSRDVVAVTATDETHRTRCEPFVRPLWRAAVEQHASVEAAFAIGAQRLKAVLGGTPEAASRYLATGGSAGRQNSFAG